MAFHVVCLAIASAPASASSSDTIMAAFYVSSAYGAIGPLMGSWLNSCSGGDKVLRALSSALMSSIGL